MKKGLFCYHYPQLRSVRLSRSDAAHSTSTDAAIIGDRIYAVIQRHRAE